MKKIIQRLLAAALCFALLFSASVPAGATGFTDIYNGYPYQDAVNYVSDNDIMTGTNKTTFSPNNALTRAMMVSILYRKAGKPDISDPIKYPDHKFTDVPDGAYYENALIWAVGEGITSGTSTTTFSPDKTLTREQAMCFLYNYMKKTTVTVRDNFDNINGQERKEVTDILKKYSDQGTISSYARPAMAWAEKRGVLIITDPYKIEIYPKHTMSRVQAAYGITAFGTNVERILFEKDNLNIENNKNYFTEDQVYMTSTHKAKLQSLSSKKMGPAGVAYINDTLTSSPEWGGACFGMSSVTLLDKLGKIAFNENYGYNKPKMYDIKSIKKTSAESAINYYQSAQSLLDIERTSQFASELLQCAKSNGPSLIRIWWDKTENGKTQEVGHAVVARSCSQLSNGTSYELQIYNPSFLVKEKWILDVYGNQTLTRYLPSGTITITNKLKYISVITDTDSKKDLLMNFNSIFNKADIDTYKNTDQGGSLARTSEIDSLQKYDGKSSFLLVNLIGEFKIENEKAESIQWDGVDLSGDMDILSVSVTSNGEDRAASMLIQVPISDTFTFERSAGSEAQFSVIDAYRYSRVSGTNVKTVTVEKSGKLVLEGNEVDFEAAYSKPEQESNLIKVSGIGSNIEITTSFDQAIKVMGVQDVYTVDLYNAFGQFVERSEIESVIPDVSSNEEAKEIPAISEEVYE